MQKTSIFIIIGYLWSRFGIFHGVEQVYKCVSTWFGPHQCTLIEVCIYDIFTILTAILLVMLYRKLRYIYIYVFITQHRPQSKLSIRSTFYAKPSLPMTRTWVSLNNFSSLEKNEKLAEFAKSLSTRWYNRLSCTIFSALSQQKTQRLFYLGRSVTVYMCVCICFMSKLTKN